MRLTSALTVLAVVAAQAAAVPEAKPVAPAQVYERDAAPAAEADPKWSKKSRKKGMWFGFCGVPGQACGRRRSAEAEPEAEAARRYRLWYGFCGVPGQACGKARDAPEQEVGHEVGFCGAPGEPCAQVKRSANAIAEALAEAKPRKKYRLWYGFCGVPGQACGKARDLIDNVIDHTNDVYGAIYEREAEAEAVANPEAKKKSRKNGLWFGFCGVPGQACGRRREAEALAEANQKIKRDADPEAKKKSRKNGLWFGFCGVPGQACGKPRNAEAMAAAINKADPSIFKNTCFAKGGDCDTLLRIQKAFHESKQASKDERRISDPQQKLAHCGGKNECTALTHMHQYAKQHGPRSADEAEAACNGPEGLCTLAGRDLDGIENTINEAVEAMAADHGIPADETEDDSE